MKKILLFLFTASLGIFSATAQDTRYGARLGVNFSSISSDDIGEAFDDGRYGVVFGLFAKYALSKNIGIQPELQYSTQGNKEKSLRVNYVQLPIVFKYSFSELVNIQLGPQAGLKVWEWEDKTPLEADFSTFDFSALAGIGVNITDNFFIDARYVFGFSNVFNDENIPNGYEGNTRNIQVSIGYRL